MELEECLRRELASIAVILQGVSRPALDTRPWILRIASALLAGVIL